MSVERGYWMGGEQAPATEVFGSYTLPERAPSGFALGAGDQLQIWTITARVNAGVNAHVYRARDPDALSDRDVALKVLLPQSAHGRQDQVVHEVAAMSSLTRGHPHLMSATIARRITAGPYTGGVLIVMPWAELNLREYVLAIRRGDPLPDGGRWARPTALCEALAGIADGLAQLHDLQTAHGDVKPDNIMLVDGVWKLGDFGLTRPMEGSYVLSAPGTLSYTAPEEARAQHADPTAQIKRRPAGDVWALGVTLHFAVTGGRFPMPGISPDERLAAVRQGDIRIYPGISPPAVGDLLADQLLVDDRRQGATSYARRITAARAAEALRRIAASEAPPTRRIRVDPELDTDALLRYRGQCERVSAQTVELWRDLGPWDGPSAATTQRSRSVLRTMLTNRLTGLEPPPELRLRKSVFARALGLRAPYESCRGAAQETTIDRYAAPLEHSRRMAGWAAALLIVGVLSTPLITLSIFPGTAGTLPAAALALIAGTALLGGLVLRARFPEPAYIAGSRWGPVVGVCTGLVVGVVAMWALGQTLDIGGFPRPGRTLLLALVLAPIGVTMALIGGYVAGTASTRRAIRRRLQAANSTPYP